MPKEKTTTKKNTAKWDALQKIGFWGLIIVSIAFWGGVYIGSSAAYNDINEVKAAQAQAVEEYKSTLKQSQQ